MKIVSLFCSTLMLFSVIGLQAQDPTDRKKVVLFFGDSITAGYGVDLSQAYPSFIQNKINAKKIPYKVLNAGLSGDTTSAGVQRLSWVLRQPVEVLVLALGGNDGLRGVPPKTTEQNLQTMIDVARERYPTIKIVLAGMKMPPNYGQSYVKEFEAIYPRLVKKNKVYFVPFLLEGVGGIPELNLPDRIHPTAEGQEIIAETVWKVLESVL